MSDFSTSQVDAFFESVVWKVIKERLESELQMCDSEIEKPDPFAHGKAVGQRDKIRAMLGYPERLRQEAGGK